MVKVYVGDVFTSGADIICHQVNCLGIMGAGIALEIRRRYPKVYDEYINYTHSRDDYKSRLGEVLYVPTGENSPIIANIFGQLEIGKGLQTNYDALRKAFTNIKEYANKNNMSIAIPHGIGCGLAGGDWNVVYGIINEVFCDDIDDVTIYVFRQKRWSVGFYV